jgi:hypothetical protein
MKTSRFISTLSVSASAILAATLTSASPAEAALSDCPSGYMCVWSGTSYSGSIQRFSATGRYLSIALPRVESYYNNRARRTLLTQNSNGSGYSACFNPGTRNSDLSGWKNTAKAVYLSTAASC